MSALPAELPISLESVCALTVEVWRLKRISEQDIMSSERLTLRHAVRRLGEVLVEMGVEAVDFVGRQHDPGMVPEVVGVEEDEAFEGKPSVIDETVSPTVMWRGVVVRSGQVIVRQSPVKRIEAMKEQS